MNQDQPIGNPAVPEDALTATRGDVTHLLD